MYTELFLGGTALIAFFSYFNYPDSKSMEIFSLIYAIVVVVAFILATVLKVKKLKRENPPIVYKICGIFEKINIAVRITLFLIIWYFIVLMIAYHRILDPFFAHTTIEEQALILLFLFAAYVIYTAIKSKKRNRV